MTPEAQRIAIAEACGYRRNQKTGKWDNDNRQMRRLSYVLPDYLNDLNAMHEAENSIWHSQGLRLKFSDNLNAVCMRDRANCWHATAAQRAEAFLRTIGKWTE